MKKAIILIYLLIVSYNGLCQSKGQLTFDTLKSNLIEDLYAIKAIDTVWMENVKKGEYSLNISGLENNLREGDLKNGIYFFNIKRYSYFVLVENSHYMLLDFRSRHGLDLSVLNLMDFCERNNYCVQVTNNYVTKLIGIYYHVNKDLSRGLDVNCEKGIKDTKGLP
nr:hypothetical protein [uncultured Flavobacterium sp.]